MIVVYPDGQVSIVGRKNPFRYTLIKRLYKKQDVEAPEPSGEDDTQAIQNAVDELEELLPQLIEISLTRRWKLPWKYRIGFAEENVIIVGTLRFQRGTYKVSKPILLDSNIHVLDLNAQGSPDCLFRVGASAKNTIIESCSLRGTYTHKI